MLRLVAVTAVTLLLGLATASADDKQDCGQSVGQPDLAITACTTLITGGTLAGPDLAYAYHNRGIAYHVKGDIDKALPDYDQAVALDPKNALQHSNRGLAYSWKGDMARALADFDDAVRLDPNTALNYRHRGYTYYLKGGNWNNGTLTVDTLPSLFYAERAVADLNKAIAMNGGDPEAYYDRGLVYAVRGERDPAIADFKKALELKPDFQEARTALETLGVQP